MRVFYFGAVVVTHKGCQNGDKASNGDKVGHRAETGRRTAKKSSALRSSKSSKRKTSRLSQQPTGLPYVPVSEKLKIPPAVELNPEIEEEIEKSALKAPEADITEAQATTWLEKTSSLY